MSYRYTIYRDDRPLDMREIESLFFLQCPCLNVDCGTFIGRKDYQLGFERIALEQHEFWTHDYTGEMDVVTGTVEFV